MAPSSKQLVVVARFLRTTVSRTGMTIVCGNEYEGKALRETSTCSRSAIVLASRSHLFARLRLSRPRLIAAPPVLPVAWRGDFHSTGYKTKPFEGVATHYFFRELLI